MKSSLVSFILGLLTLIIGAATEEMAPKFLSVGFPVLLAATEYFAGRRTYLIALAFAIAAGGFEDALTELPFLTSVSFFTLLTVFTRWAKLPYPMTLLMYPGYQLWLTLWSADSHGEIFGRFLMAMPIGLITSLVVFAVLSRVEKRIGVDEQE